MQVKQLLINLPFLKEKTYKILNLKNPSIKKIQQRLNFLYKLNPELYSIYSNNKLLSKIDENSNLLYIRFKLKGGKGGFQSTLRKEAIHKKRFTNTLTSKNLEGRKIRDVKNEIRLKKWIKEREEKKKMENDKKVEKKNNFGEKKINFLEKEIGKKYEKNLKKWEFDIKNRIDNLKKKKIVKKKNIKKNIKKNLKFNLKSILSNIKSKKKVNFSEKKKIEVIEDFDINDIINKNELKNFSRESLKNKLKTLGIKYGGISEVLIDRIWLIKNNPALMFNKKFLIKNK